LRHSSLMTPRHAGPSSTTPPRAGSSSTTLPPPRVRVLLTVKFRQPSHEFTFSVGMTFRSYPLVITPVV
jgi:hypothetical protein